MVEIFSERCIVEDSFHQIDLLFFCFGSRNVILLEDFLNSCLFLSQIFDVLFHALYFAFCSVISFKGRFDSRTCLFCWGFFERRKTKGFIVGRGQ